MLLLLVDDVQDGPAVTAMMPSVEAFAARSTSFTNAHASGTSCGPSRASLLTGRWPTSNRELANAINGTNICTNKQARGFTTDRRKHATLPALLKSSGYHVGGAGKIFHQDACEFGTNSDDAFDEYFHSLPEMRADGSTAKYVCSGVTERDETNAHDAGDQLMPEPNQRYCECANHGRLDLANMVAAARSPFPDLVWNASSTAPLPDSRITSWVLQFLARRAAQMQWRQTAAPSSMAASSTTHHQPFFLGVGLHGGHAPYVVEHQSRVDAAAHAERSLAFNTSEAVRDLEVLSREAKSIAAGRDAALRKSEEDVAERVRQIVVLRSEATQRRVTTERISYLARLAETDHHISLILGAVAQNPALERSTMTLLTADHGVHLGEKGVAVGAKWTLWERTSRVPFIISIPSGLLAALPAGTRRNHAVTVAVSLVDVVPTLLESSGASAAGDSPLAGISLLPMLSEQRLAARASGRSVLVTHCPGRRLLGYAVRNERWRYVSYSSRTKGTRAGHGWKTAEEAAGAGAELFDLLSDPYEQNNLLKRREATARIDRAASLQWEAMEKSLQVLLAGGQQLARGG